jgi:hypothetical protein
MEISDFFGCEPDTECFFDGKHELDLSDGIPISDLAGACFGPQRKARIVEDFLKNRIELSDRRHIRIVRAAAFAGFRRTALNLGQKDSSEFPAGNNIAAVEHRDFQNNRTYGLLDLCHFGADINALAGNRRLHKIQLHSRAYGVFEVLAHNPREKRGQEKSVLHAIRKAEPFCCLRIGVDGAVVTAQGGELIHLRVAEALGGLENPADLNLFETRWSWDYIEWHVDLVVGLAPGRSVIPKKDESASSKILLRFA